MTTTDRTPVDLLEALARSVGTTVADAVARYEAERDAAPFAVGDTVTVPAPGRSRYAGVTGARRVGTVVYVEDHGPWGRPSGLNLVPAGVDPEDTCYVVGVDLGRPFGVRRFGADLVAPDDVDDGDSTPSYDRTFEG